MNNVNVHQGEVGEGTQLGVHMNNVNVHQGEVGEGTQLKEVFFARVLHFEQEAATFSL